MKEKKPSRYAKSLLKWVARQSGLDSFFLYGGRAISLISYKRRKCYDIDIATKMSRKKMVRCENSLKRNGWKMMCPVQVHYIRFNKKVFLLYAKKEKVVLEIGFMKEPEMVGVYNLDSAYFRYPELDMVDRFGTIDGLREKRVCFVGDPRNENPFILLRLFLRACAKNGICISNRKNWPVLHSLGFYLKIWRPPKKDFQWQAKAACISSILKAVVICRKKKVFMRQLGKTGLVKFFFPALHEAILNSVESFSDRELQGIKSKIDLCRFLEYARPGFLSGLDCLKIRIWDEQDKALVSFVRDWRGLDGGIDDC